MDFLNGEIQMYCGDCLTLMDNIATGSVDMVLCDLPYGITQCGWDTVIPFDALWAQYNRIVKPNGAVVLFGAEPFSSMLRVSNLSAFRYDWIWNKVRGTGFLNARKQPLRVHEMISVFYRQQCLYNPQKIDGCIKKISYKREGLNSPLYGDTRGDVYYESTERYPLSIQTVSTESQYNALHPTQKPVALCEYLIKTYTNKGEVVLDNCMGSGSTGEACINAERKFIGIEISPEYYATAVKRIEADVALLEAKPKSTGTDDVWLSTML